MLVVVFVVGLFIVGMYFVCCIYLLGGVIVLIVVIGGVLVYFFGFFFVWNLVIINCLVILIIGVFFNYVFFWWCYLVSLMYYVVFKRQLSDWLIVLEVQIEEVMEWFNVVIDINLVELGQIIEQIFYYVRMLGVRKLLEIKVGCSYCNDVLGLLWFICQIVDEWFFDNLEFDLVIYKMLEGVGKYCFGNCMWSEFVQWVGYELELGNSC